MESEFPNQGNPQRDSAFIGRALGRSPCHADFFLRPSSAAMQISFEINDTAPPGGCRKFIANYNSEKFNNDQGVFVFFISEYEYKISHFYKTVLQRSQILENYIDIEILPDSLLESQKIRGISGFLGRVRAVHDTRPDDIATSWREGTRQCQSVCREAPPRRSPTGPLAF
ncbi:hypothetical protein [Rhizobium sp. C4]|uniref:hypothetical protein n=1 Tax=Rhizobium sp. C4 TaxID=1349800 RepID=UPI001E3BE219|nr:hypothetical protein [Rhizobium sp. C4]MCD2176187.1 hypothetical protein [Rhizobium sp. C4]